MKKILVFMCVFAAVIGAVGCAQHDAADAIATEKTPQAATAEPQAVYFPDNSFLGTLNFSDMTYEQAAEILENAIESYILTVSTETGSVHIPAAHLQLEANTDMLRQWLETGVKPDQLLRYDITTVTAALENAFGEPAKNASVRYDSDTGRFVTVQEKNGTGVDAGQALADAENAINQLCPAVQTTITLYPTDPQITASDPLVSQAAQKADRYLRPDLKYIYNIPDSKSITASIKKSELASFVAVSEDLSVTLDDRAIKSYIAKMAGKYGGQVTEGDLRAYSGAIVGRTVDYFGSVLDQKAMYDDLVQCLENGISGSRMNNYIPVKTHLPYGGNYVEIDLKQQKLYVLQDGNVIVSTDIVSGDIVTGDWTENGVFSIYDKDTDCWLTGSDFRDFVSYWMGFNGNIGMHDASWRTVFGSEIYKYDGSHGCINMPVEIVSDVYNNVSLGTRVIVHSAIGSVENMTQQITGTASYTLTERDAPFILDTVLAYAGPGISYSSSDESVVTVNELGIVTPAGPGTAQITVRTEQLGPLSDAEFVIDITVNPWVSNAKPIRNILDFFTSLKSFSEYLKICTCYFVTHGV